MFYMFIYLPLKEGVNIHLNKLEFLQSLVKIGPVGLEKQLKCRKSLQIARQPARQTDGRQTKTMFRRTHYSFQIRWAKKSSLKRNCANYTGIQRMFIMYSFQIIKRWHGGNPNIEIVMEKEMTAIYHSEKYLNCYSTFLLDLPWVEYIIFYGRVTSDFIFKWFLLCCYYLWSTNDVCETLGICHKKWIFEEIIHLIVYAFVQLFPKFSIFCRVLMNSSLGLHSFSTHA